MKMDHLTVMYILSVEVKNTVVLAASHENSAFLFGAADYMQWKHENK